MVVNEEDFKKNAGKYLLISESEDVYIVRNGSTVARLQNMYRDRIDMARPAPSIEDIH